MYNHFVYSLLFASNGAKSRAFKNQKIMFLNHKPLFLLGKVYSTAGVGASSSLNSKFKTFLFNSLRRHAKGDWGDCCEDDKQSNDRAVKNGSRVFSVYHIPSNIGVEMEAIWIITEADRSSTTILFPSEY